MNTNDEKHIEIMRSIIAHIQKDIIEGEITYLREKDKNKSEFEKGVYATIRLIEFRIYCIMDD